VTGVEVNYVYVGVGFVFERQSLGHFGIVFNKQNFPGLANNIARECASTRANLNNGITGSQISRF
jgi:hypothetical protein